MPWRLSDGVRWLDVDDGVVILEPRSGRFVDLNESAGELWCVLISSSWSVEGAVDHLVTEHGIPPDDARRIVDAVVDDLEAQDVIRAS